MRASKGFRRGTRSKLKKGSRDKFKVGDFLKEFKADDRVIVKAKPSSHKGMPHPRFEGRPGKVMGKRGNAYIVEVSSGNAKRTVIARPEHLKLVKQ
jgi:large subunit ribosomal protein L21e